MEQDAPSLLLRQATAADLPVLCALEQACFSDPWSATGLRSHLQSATGEASLALLDGAVVGYLLCQCIPPEGEVYRVGVLPACRGRGIARQLLQDFFARRTELSVCFLEVRAGNIPALALYTGLGFVRVGIRRQYYSAPPEDGVVMKWERS